MLKDILSVVPTGNARFLGGYLRLLATIQTRMDIVKTRFTQLVDLPRTPGVETLSWMLYNLNLEDAKSYKDDFELYVDMFEKAATKYRVVFDPVVSKTLARGKFYHAKTGTNPTEVFLNTSVASPISSLPFGKDWYAWQDIRAVRHLYHDSVELPYDMNSGYATFERSPTFAVMSIDIPVLLMKYIKYRKAWARGMPHQLTPERFLKYEYVHFFDDFVNIWVTQLVYYICTRPNADPKKLVDELNVSRFIADKSVVEVGVRALQEVLKLIDSRNIKFQDLLACEVYPKGSIRDKINELDDNIILPESLGYLWLDVLKSLPYFQIITAVFDRDKDNPVYQQVMRKAQWIWAKTIKPTKLPNLQFSGTVRSFVELALTTMANIFDAKLDLPVESTTKA